MKTMTIILGLLITNALHAKASSCAVAKLQSSESCSKLKVKFDLSQCGSDGPKNGQASVRCEGQQAFATYEFQGRTWTAQYKKMASNWGQVEWKKVSFKETLATPSSKASQSSEKVVSEPLKERIPSSEVSPKALGGALPKLNGYFDFRFNSIENNDNPLITNSGNRESGFSIDEAALQVGHQFTDFNFYLDLPVRREKNTDGASENNNFTLGADRAQAYIKMGLSGTVNLTLGQFDTPYGVELNDSKDRVFAKTGLLYDYALPVTHTGLSVDGAWSSINYRFLVANSNNKGSFGSTTTGDNQEEAGLTLGYSNEKYRSQVGYLTRKIKKSNGEHGGTRNLLDVTLGGTWGAFSLDLEYAQVDNDNKAANKSGAVVFILPTYKISEKVLLGMRYESLTDDAGATGTIDFARSLGLSAHWIYNQNLRFQAEYIQFYYETPTTDGTQNRVTLTSLFSF